MNMLLYGFCMQAGLGIVLWLFTRLGRVPLAQGGVIIMGVYLMNFGVLAGVISARDQLAPLASSEAIIDHMRAHVSSLLGNGQYRAGQPA